MSASQSPQKTAEGTKPNQEQSFLGFYNSMASCLKKYTAAIPTQIKRSDSETSTSAAPAAPPEPDVPAPIQMIEPDIPELPSAPELPPGVLYQLDDGIVFRILTDEYVDEAARLLCDHFFKDEPLGKALYVESPQEIDHWLTKALPHMIRHEVSIMALNESDPENAKLIGVAINSVKFQGQTRGPDDFLTWIKKDKDPKMYKILSFLADLVNDIDFYGNYQVDKLFSLDLLNVDKSYGGRGIASKLVEQSVDVAKERKFKCLITETTGIFSAKIFARNGFKTIREVSYASQREHGRLLFPGTGIHTSAKVAVKILNQ